MTSSAAAPILNPMTPVAAPGSVGTLFTGATLAASGAWTRSDIVNVQNYRRLTMLLDYDPAGAGGYPGIIVLGSNGTTSDPFSTPAAGDDSWFQLSTVDGSVTSAVGSGTLPTGADYTIVQPEGWVTVYPMIIRLTAATNATDEYRQAITVDVGPYRWVHIIAAEVGNTGSPGALAAYYSLSQ